MTRRKKKGYSAKPLSAHEAGKIAPHKGKNPAPPPGKALYDPDEKEAAPRESLTVSESEVLADIAHGQSNQEISRRKKVALATVEKHIERIYPKLGVKNRTAAAIWFLNRQLAAKDRQLAAKDRRIAELERLLEAKG